MAALNLSPLLEWCNERHAIYLRKTLLEGTVPPKEYAPVFPLTEPKTWTLDHLTDDPILSTWRATNAFRELDRVTAWIRENIREPFADHQDLWFMLAAGRILNWPKTLKMLIETDGAWPSHTGFKPENMTAALEAWHAAGQKIEGGAYTGAEPLLSDAQIEKDFGPQQWLDAYDWQYVHHEIWCGVIRAPSTLGAFADCARPITPPQCGDENLALRSRPLRLSRLEIPN